MRFYTKQHEFYCGVDLHAGAMYVCILDAAGEIVVHQNIPTRPKAFLRLIIPYRKDLEVAAECMFTWYWLGDQPDRLTGKHPDGQITDGR